MSSLMRVRLTNDINNRIPSLFLSRNISDDFTNKKITRLESDIELESDRFHTRLINRNPLNLEQLNYEKKPSGFWLDHSSPSNYNRIKFKRSGRYLEASLTHWSGLEIIKASTSEKQLTKYYKGANTVQAATILAQVMALRCLQSGFLCAGLDSGERDESNGIKAKTFYDEMEKNGFCLKESLEIEPRSASDI